MLRWFVKKYFPRKLTKCVSILACQKKCGSKDSTVMNMTKVLLFFRTLYTFSTALKNESGNHNTIIIILSRKRTNWWIWIWVR